MLRGILAGLVIIGAGCAASKPAVTESERRRVEQSFDELEGGQEAGKTEAAKAAPQEQPRSVAVVAPTKGPKPGWVDGVPQDSGFYYGVGSSGEALEQARSRALGNLASQIEVQVTSMVRSVATERGFTRGKVNGSEVASEYTQEVELLAKQTVTDYEIAGQWSDGNQYWVYVRLDRARVKARLDKELSDARKMALDHYLAGSRMEKSGEISEALKSYTRGLAALRKFLGQLIEAEVEGRSVILTNECERSISRLLAGIELKSEEPTRQRARVDKPLPEPLVVSVSYKGQPLADMPIRFAFVKGAGELAGLQRTDAKGRAACLVYRVTSAERTNSVEARLDVEEFTGQEASQVAGLRAYLEKIGGRPAHFIIATDETRILVQVEETNLGAPVADSYLASFIKGRIAGETGATFTETRQEASLLLKGRVSSRYSSSEGKIKFCYAEVAMSLQDLRTGEELFSTKLDRVKGYHLDRDEAGRRAIEAAAVGVADSLMRYIGTEAGP